MDDIEQVAARFLTCAPAQCASEADCFRMAQWVVKHCRATRKARADLRAMLATDAGHRAQELEEIPHYAPHWEAPRRVLPDWDAA